MADSVGKLVTKELMARQGLAATFHIGFRPETAKYSNALH